MIRSSKASILPSLCPYHRHRDALAFALLSRGVSSRRVSSSRSAATAASLRAVSAAHTQNHSYSCSSPVLVDNAQRFFYHTRSETSCTPVSSANNVKEVDGRGLVEGSGLSGLLRNEAGPAVLDDGQSAAVDRSNACIQSDDSKGTTVVTANDDRIYCHPSPPTDPSTEPTLSSSAFSTTIVSPPPLPPSSSVGSLSSCPLVDTPASTSSVRGDDCSDHSSIDISSSLSTSSTYSNLSSLRCVANHSLSPTSDECISTQTGEPSPAQEGSEEVITTEGERGEERLREKPEKVVATNITTADGVLTSSSSSPASASISSPLPLSHTFTTTPHTSTPETSKNHSDSHNGKSSYYFGPSKFTKKRFEQQPLHQEGEPSTIIHAVMTEQATSSTAPAAAPAPKYALEVKNDLKLLQSGRPVPGYSNTEAAIAQHKAVTGGKPYFRFPPEPNGFLHIGHAKSMNLNFGCAEAHNGCCYLRYDDTNPETEEQVYIDAIEEMARWMGWSPNWVTYSSDHFQKLYELAIRLINEGKAYVDHSTAEEVKKQREDRVNSPWRDRPIEENLRLFEWMRQGRYAEGEATLRVKIDMQHDNPNMRDFIAYRVKYNPHPHCGDVWCIYPSYDYTHCLIDSLENIDYSLCTLEFETRRESYFWLLDVLDMWKPHVWEFSRLNVTGSLLSKRKINVLVKKGIVRGFDDPRLLTLAGLRRRGYTPEAINHFCDLIGITRSMNVIQIGMLEQALREDLDERCPRRQLIVDPVKVVIDNWKGIKVCKCANHPRKPELGERDVEFSHEFYIDRSDFHEVDDNPKFYGLAPGPRPVGLKYNGNIVCTSVEKDSKGTVVAIHCDIDFDRTAKPKTNITWVSCHNAALVETRLYTYLLKDDRAAIDPDFLKFIDDKSESVVVSAAEPAILDMQVFDKFQAERFGYFVVDVDSKPAEKKIVLNRTVSLKEDKEKAPAAPARAPAAPKKKEEKKDKKEKAAATATPTHADPSA